jgi:hypothetical protein
MAGREGSKDRQQANAAVVDILIVILLGAMQSWKMECKKIPVRPAAAIARTQRLRQHLRLL